MMKSKIPNFGCDVTLITWLWGGKTSSLIILSFFGSFETRNLVFDGKGNNDSTTQPLNLQVVLHIFQCCLNEGYKSTIWLSLMSALVNCRPCSLRVRRYQGASTKRRILVFVSVNDIRFDDHPMSPSELCQAFTQAILPRWQSITCVIVTLCVIRWRE